MISEATLGVTVEPLGRELSDVAFALRQSTVEIRTRGTGVGSGIVWNRTGTIVTWGAGLATFSMAVVDAKTGQVYFPPFDEVGASSYGLPYLDKGDNPAWRIDSKLFAFVGMPDWDQSKGEGMYLYAFNRGRFRLIRFIKNNAEGRRELGLEP